MAIHNKERHVSTGTTVLHATDSIELAVSTPDSSSSKQQRRSKSTKDKRTPSLPKVRDLFKIKKTPSRRFLRSSKSCDDLASSQEVVITPKVKRNSLTVDVPDVPRINTDLRTIAYKPNNDDTASAPDAIPTGSSASTTSKSTIGDDSTMMQCTFSDSINLAWGDDLPQESFFAVTDFTKSNWMETVTSQSTQSLSLGFISVMAATVVIHPIIFVTGAAAAVWAVGVVHAVEKGYQFFTDGEFQQLFWADSEDVQDEDKVEEKQAEKVCEDSSHTQSSSTAMSPCSDPPSPLFSPREKSNRRHINPMDKAILAHFPQLDNEVVTAEFPGLNALEFFYVFFSDKAPFSWKEFQESIGDVDINYGKWDKQKETPFTFHPSVLNTPREVLPKLPASSRKERVLEFKTLTKSYFGPAYAKARKVQRVTKFSTRLVIIECKTELFNIPYSDRFFVLERWVIESTKHDKSVNPAMLYNTKISVSVQVFMLKDCNFEKQIRSKTLSTVTGLVTTWCEKATKALDLTLKKKLERMRLKLDTQDTKSIYSSHSANTSLSKPLKSSLLSNSNSDIRPKGGKEQALLKIHNKQLKIIEKKIAAGDMECIETKHCQLAGEGLAFARVLGQDDNNDSNNANQEETNTKMKNKKSKNLKRLVFKKKNR